MNRPVNPSYRLHARRPAPPDPAALVPEIESWLHRLYIAAEGAGLRKEDRRKAIEVAAMLDEIRRALRRFTRHAPLLLVDAAAGKSYVGLLAAKLILEPAERQAAVITIERDPRRAAMSREAVGHLKSLIPIECRTADISSAAAWPDNPSMVVALHACGPAADAVIDRASASGARVLLLVPCCTSRAVTAMAQAEQEAARLAIPRQAPVRRRFLQAMVDADRTKRLQEAGYETEVVEFVGATTTPHNLLWRCRRVRPTSGKT